MKTDISVIRGTTNTFSITVTDASGNLYNLKDGERLLFGVKHKVTDSEYIFIKVADSGENGVYTITLNPKDTEMCDCCGYLYDVAIQSGEDFFNIIEASRFDVQPNVTKWGCSG